MSDAAAVASELMKTPTVVGPLVLAGLASLALAGNQIMAFIERVRPKPAPKEVQDEARETSHNLAHRVTAVEVNHQALVERVEQHDEVFETIHCRERACETSLHKRLDDVSASLNTLGGKYSEGMAAVKDSLSEIRSIVLARGPGGGKPR